MKHTLDTDIRSEPTSSSGRSPKSEVRVQSQPRTCDNCSGQNADGAGSPPDT